jgi:flagellar motor switch protein FliN/FliY
MPYKDPEQPLTPPEQAAREPRQLDFMADVPLGVTVQFGATTITLERLLKLAVGSVIELDGRPGEPLAITVKGKTVAHGEVVVVNDRYGVRLTEVVEPSK